jgi:hypothetical protein
LQEEREELVFPHLWPRMAMANSWKKKVKLHKVRELKANVSKVRIQLLALLDQLKQQIA